MIKATVTMENDNIQMDSNIKGTGMDILRELAALNATIIRQLLDNPPYSFQKADNVPEILRGLTKQGLDSFDEESDKAILMANGGNLS